MSQRNESTIIKQTSRIYVHEETERERERKLSKNRVDMPNEQTDYDTVTI